LFDPRNAGDRVDYAARTVIAHLDRKDRQSGAATFSKVGLSRLRNAVIATYGASGLSRDAFRQRFLDPYTSDEAVDQWRETAKALVEARTHQALGVAGEKLTQTIKGIGLSRWPRRLADLNDDAIKAVDDGAVPGVVRVAGVLDDVVGGLGAGALLGWALGVYPGGPNWPGTKQAAPTAPSIVEQQAPPDPDKKAEPAPAQSEQPADEPADEALDRFLPANPDDLRAEGYKEISDPRAVARGHRTFTNPETGDRIRFDKGDPNEPGYARRDHYRRMNPNSVNKRDYYLDKNGNPTSRSSDDSHIFPENKK
jgi:hypothetical protein